MKILFLHQNFPGQFKSVPDSLIALRHELLALVPQTHDRASRVPTVRYALEAPGAPGPLEPSADVTERFARGAAVAHKLHELKSEGYTPDVVVAHPGWGESLFVRDVWPSVRLVVHAEFFYTAVSAGFDPEFTSAPPPLVGVDLRIRNVPMTLALLDADIGIAPTPWQASVFPELLRSKLSVVHEGVDTNLVAPRPDAHIRVRNGPAFTREDEVVTFVNRNLEPHRGFHTFMRALPLFQARRPKAHVIMVGGAGHSYGPPPRSGGSWKDVLLKELEGRLDLSRIHFVGRVPHPALVRLFQVSSAHVYLTYPFVLSWSMLEAMSAGAPVVGSRTAPVEDVITHSENGLLCDFFDPEGLAESVISLLTDRALARKLGDAGRETVKARFDLRTVCLPQWLEIIGA
jgi:glycosyltransferase involved in cell wall biosynthesis